METKCRWKSYSVWMRESIIHEVTFETQKQEEVHGMRVWRESFKEEDTARAKALRREGA